MVSVWVRGARARWARAQKPAHDGARLCANLANQLDLVLDLEFACMSRHAPVDPIPPGLVFVEHFKIYRWMCAIDVYVGRVQGIGGNGRSDLTGGMSFLFGCVCVCVCPGMRR